VSRSLLRRVAGPAAFALERQLRWTAARAGVVLVYHRVSDDRVKEPSLVPTITRSEFAAHLRHLRRHYRVVAAEDILTAIENRTRGGPFPVALTFDDDLSSHIDVAAPELTRARLPATFFLCGASLDGPHAFWWERLERAARTADVSALQSRLGVLSEDSLRSLALAVEGLPPGDRQRVSDRLLEIAPGDEDRGLRGADVRELASTGFAIGFHTASHDRLTTLDDTALTAAMSDGRRRVEDAAAREVRALAYPHGRADRRVIDAADRAGYTVAFTAYGHGVGPGADRLSIDRIEPSHLSADLLAFRISRSLLRAGRDRSRTAA
jgi:peptidoglycan/xylan/chitin deacetylase (PgdA/CDA1 family)